MPSGNNSSQTTLQLIFTITITIELLKNIIELEVAFLQTRRFFYKVHGNRHLKYVTIKTTRVVI